MAFLKYKIACMNCKKYNDTAQGILFPWGQESELFKNDYRNKNGEFEDEFNDEFYNEFEEKPEWNENEERIKASNKLISKQEAIPLIRMYHDDTSYRCEYCGGRDCFIYTEIMVDNILLNGINEEINLSRNYESVKIGSQVWMEKNLNVSHFKNGDIIPQALSPDEWFIYGVLKKKPVWCYLDFSHDGGECYGKLYNWYAVNDPRGLAPEGWHIPTQNEWKTLIDFVGGARKASKKLKATGEWAEDVFEDSTNEYGFSAFPAGRTKDSMGITNTEIYNIACWWSGSEFEEAPDETAFSMILDGREETVSILPDYKRNGFSIRCLKN